MRTDISRVLATATTAAGLLLAAGPAWAQFGGDRPGGFSGGFGRSSAEPVVSVQAQFTAPSADRPGQLFVDATIQSGWHIYSITQASGGPVASQVRLKPSDAYRLAGDFQASPPPKKKPEPVFDNLVVESHYDRVVWHAPVEFAPGVDPARLKIEGSLYAQPCDADSCLPPQSFPFTATLGEGLAVPASEAPEAGPRFQPEQVQPEETVQATSMGMALLFAFGGGLILNVMPCVLPVIGLKILAFFNQAGESRARAFILNVWYALGLLSVFLVLAALGVGLSEMFTAELFGIIMAVVVFAMALSLMGVWELQVPSFLGSGKSRELTEREGASGAFFKGIITTLLAIPCGAPLLSPALKWTDQQVRAGAPENVYLAFAVIGLGMASPYLVIGAFPELLRFLPKPGPWMDTFKKTMGYLLLAAVVWILYFLPIEDVVPTIGLLFGIWLGCWLVGRVPLTASPSAKARSWGAALAVVTVTALICFPLWLRPAVRHRLDKVVARAIQDGSQDQAVVARLLALQASSPVTADNQTQDAGMASAGQLSAVGGGFRPPDLAPEFATAAEGRSAESELPWQPFSRALFERLVAANKTILVDFTADWCLTCKTLEALVLNTRETREAVDRNRVVTLQADWTRGAPEVTEMLEILGSKQVPVVAIFPAGDPNRPIVLRGGYTKQTLLDALKKAGPSKG